MDVILSISDWGNFLLSRLVFDTVFIVVAILMIFAFFNRKEYANTDMLRFILTALVITLLSRYGYFVLLKTKINSRYLLPAAFYIIILCVPGFAAFVKLGNRFLKFIPSCNEKILSLLLTLIIAVVCIGKALHPPEKKEYIQDAARIMRSSNSVVMISNLEDARRVAWHSNAKFIPLTSVFNADKPVFFEYSLKKLKSNNKNFFLFVKFKDAEFRKMFNSKGLEFPKELILQKEFSERQKQFYSLYKIETINLQINNR